MGQSLAFHLAAGRWVCTGGGDSGVGCGVGGGGKARRQRVTAPTKTASDCSQRSPAAPGCTPTPRSVQRCGAGRLCRAACRLCRGERAAPPNRPRRPAAMAQRSAARDHAPAPLAASSAKRPQAAVSARGCTIAGSWGPRGAASSEHGARACRGGAESARGGVCTVWSRPKTRTDKISSQQRARHDRAHPRRRRAPHPPP